MAKSVFDFIDYKPYLRSVAGEGVRKGVRMAMAKAIRSYPAFITQVLNGDAHLSLEQGEALCGFLTFGKEEREYFLLILLHSRAGTAPLKKHFRAQIDAIRARRLVLTERLGKAHVLSEEERARYYSSWLYIAVHIALSVPALQDKKALARHFQVRQGLVAEIVDFLLGAGLVVEKPGGGYAFGPTQIRLGNDSHHIFKHHTNWRNRAIESLERESLRDLHYSGVYSLTLADAEKIKDRLLEEIKACQQVLRESREEEVYAFCVDFFNLKVLAE